MLTDMLLMIVLYSVILHSVVLHSAVLHSAVPLFCAVDFSCYFCAGFVLLSKNVKRKKETKKYVTRDYKAEQPYYSSFLIFFDFFNSYFDFYFYPDIDFFSIFFIFTFYFYFIPILILILFLIPPFLMHSRAFSSYFILLFPLLFNNPHPVTFKR